MIIPGEIISYFDLNKEEEASLQRGMNYRLKHNYSVILMSTRKGAPYDDSIKDDGKILIYEGHDIPQTKFGPNPKTQDQELKLPSGKLTQNGKFYFAAIEYKDGKRESENVKVYEKIKSGIWVYNGIFKLVDSWIEKSNNRNVFKFKLVITQNDLAEEINFKKNDLEHNRMIPSKVKLEVWKRDQGRCVKCGSRDNLHYDHIIPFSKGGTSLKAENIQLLCARHNLKKSNKIE